jgi:protein gp37
MHPDWPCAIRDQCQAAGVPFFFKQWGHWAPDPRQHHPRGDYVARLPGAPRTCADVAVMAPLGKRAAGRRLDGREWDQIPGIRGQETGQDQEESR